MSLTNVLGPAEDAAYPSVDVAIRCDVGKVREENQDRAVAVATMLGALFIVADGVGGLKSGALAAQMAVDGYGKYLATADRETEPATALQQATQVVNQAIVGEAAEQAMGSTVALLLLRATKAYIGHAGDSRVYLIRGGEMSLLTSDHSIVQKMIDHGILTEAQSRTHPDASVLTRSLGQPNVELELAEMDWAPGDALLLCSDGLWGYISEEALREAACAPAGTADEMADRLLDLALEAGGGDNISIIFLRLPS
jgi:serine/threonine protein phosphatase PrpC